MDRRELLKMIAVLTGAAVVGGDVFLSGCTSPAKDDTWFTANRIALLDEVGETIIPATDTPGAKAAKVGEFMKVIVNDCYPQESQEAFKKGLETLQDACKKMHGKNFMECSAEERKSFLMSLEEEATKYNVPVEEADKARREEMKKQGKEYDFVGKPRHYYTMMKQLTLWGYFTSKEGATLALRHLPVPGKYDGAYPYKKGDKAWS